MYATDATYRRSVAFASPLGAAQLARSVRALLEASALTGSPAALNALAGAACRAFAEDRATARGVVGALEAAVAPDVAGVQAAFDDDGVLIVARRLVADRAALTSVVDAASWRAYADSAVARLGLTKRGAFLAPARLLLTGRTSGSDVGAQLGLARAAEGLGVEAAVGVEARVALLGECLLK